MRLKDLERDEAFAWEVLKKAPYATLAMTGADGAPYCVPINHVADETYRVLYFHCAGAGEKWEVLKTNPQVCLTAVSRMSIVPNEFDTAYDSAVVRGQAAPKQEPRPADAPRHGRLLPQRQPPPPDAGSPRGWRPFPPGGHRRRRRTPAPATPASEAPRCRSRSSPTGESGRNHGW